MLLMSVAMVLEKTITELLVPQPAELVLWWFGGESVMLLKSVAAIYRARWVGISTTTAGRWC